MVGQLVDEALGKERVLGIAHAAPETDRHGGIDHRMAHGDIGQRVRQVHHAFDRLGIDAALDPVREIADVDR
ncbi:hypothetical protein D3C86_2060140 [compost metagenome]